MRFAIESVARQVRLYRPDGNPLRRRSDRLEGTGLLVAALLVLLSLWPAVAGARQAYAAALAAAEERRQVSATLLEDPPVAYLSFGEVAGGGLTAAWWTAPDGHRRRGQVRATASAKAGTTVPIWVDAAGRPLGPPPDAAQLRIEATVTALLIVSVAGLFSTVTFLFFRRGLDRARHRQWAAAWALADERWRRRRRPGRG